MVTDTLPPLMRSDHSFSAVGPYRLLQHEPPPHVHHEGLAWASCLRDTQRTCVALLRPKPITSRQPFYTGGSDMPRVTRAELPYVELLNMICLAEGRAGTYLKAWADTTTAPELKACLALVAARETSHYEVFKRRIEELGATVQEHEDPGFQEHLRVLGSGMADLEKIRWQQASQQRQPRPTLRERYEAAIADETIDP